MIPRPETEMLVDYGLEVKPQVVLDLCAGTGCVGIALAKQIDCSVIAIEKSTRACEYLRANIELNQVQRKIEVIHGDVFQYCNLPINPNKSYYIAVNPPYLSTLEMQTLQKEVTFEPEEALFGGTDGLDFYRAFFEVWGTVLRSSNVTFACEVGDGQANAVCELMQAIGLNPQTKKDFNNIERIVHN